MRRATIAVLAVLMLPVACTSAGPGTGSVLPRRSTSHPTPPRSRTPARAPTSTAPSHTPTRSTTTRPASTAAAVLAGMSESERVGQLIMVDCPTSGVTAATAQAIRDDHVGAVILDGTTSAGSAAISALTSQLQSTNPSPARLFIATDQEGGLVQRLRGAGFETIPSALDQGGLDAGSLRADAARWGAQLRGAGVNVDLAPVLDTVPADGGPNPPIGDLDREYGHDPSTVLTHGLAVAEGLADAGVAATVKHFPGLGRVSGNTDLTAGVTDTVTTSTDPYLRPFQAAVAAGVPFVMVSTAIYQRIDPGVPAIFSHRIVTDLLRRRLGFGGVVITDDIGAAAQVRSVPVGERAVRFVTAGGDMVLTVDAGQAATLAQALLARAERDPSFKALVDAAALRVLEAKQRQGLLTP